MPWAISNESRGNLATLARTKRGMKRHILNRCLQSTRKLTEVMPVYPNLRTDPWYLVFTGLKSILFLRAGFQIIKVFNHTMPQHVGMRLPAILSNLRHVFTPQLGESVDKKLVIKLPAVKKLDELLKCPNSDETIHLSEAKWAFDYEEDQISYKPKMGSNALPDIFLDRCRTHMNPSSRTELAP
jgi:hypothetical protein